MGYVSKKYEPKGNVKRNSNKVVKAKQKQAGYVKEARKKQRESKNTR